MTETTAPDTAPSTSAPTGLIKPARTAVDAIVGHREIEALFGAKHRTSNKWQGRGLLPAPDFTINATDDWWLPCWWLSTIEAWAVETGRKIDKAARRRILAQAGAVRVAAPTVGAQRSKARWPAPTKEV